MSRDKEKDRAYYLKNKERITAYNAQWRAANLPRVRAAERARHAANPEHRRALKRANYAKNAETLAREARERYWADVEKSRAYYAAATLKWRRENLDKANAMDARKRAQKLRAQPAWANEFFMKEAYALARLRTKMTGHVWHVDHIVPLRGKTVCGLHVEHNLQVIPGEVNCRKRNLYWPDMPI